jgi:hypothetical protein
LFYVFIFNHLSEIINLPFHKRIRRLGQQVVVANRRSPTINRRQEPPAGFGSTSPC